MSYLIVYILPELTGLLANDRKRFVSRRLNLLVLMAVVLVIIGGSTTMAFSPGDSRTAFLTGLGWQGLLKSLLQAGENVIKSGKKDEDREGEDA